MSLPRRKTETASSGLTSCLRVPFPAARLPGKSIISPIEIREGDVISEWFADSLTGRTISLRTAASDALAIPNGFPSSCSSSSVPRPYTFTVAVEVKSSSRSFTSSKLFCCPPSTAITSLIGISMISEPSSFTRTL